MASPWGKLSTIEVKSLAEIMSEEYAHCVQEKEHKRDDRKKPIECVAPNEHSGIWENVSFSEVAAQQNEETKVNDWINCSELLASNDTSSLPDVETLPPEVLELIGCDSDAVIAQLLQSQFDTEYNEEIKNIERKLNQQSKVTLNLDNFLRNSEADLSDENADAYDDEEDKKCDWDRFETNEKMLDAIPKCGFKVDKEGEMITKHDAQLCGVRNACRVMSFPPEFSTGDAASFDFKLTNQVFNQLKTYSRREKHNRMSDRKNNMATAEMGVDVRTRLLLYKLVNNQVLEQINGIISTGKEAIILHANSDPNYSCDVDSNLNKNGSVAQAQPKLMPKECAIKIFKTTLNEFKQRDRYIKDDYRFKDRLSKQNTKVIITMWAEKEMHNLMRMKSVGINCPDVVMLKKHILVMSFVGNNRNAAPKLKDVRFTDAELSVVYEEIIAVMHKLYNEAKLVHADLSEYNILWHDGQCWFIDVAQSVEPKHPSALEFLMRDCGNIINFFSKRGLEKILSKEELFEHISGLNAETHNAAMLERIHTRGASVYEATAPNQDSCPDELKPSLDYPFDLAWEKSMDDRIKNKADKTASDTLNVQDVKYISSDILAETNTASN